MNQPERKVDEEFESIDEIEDPIQKLTQKSILCAGVILYGKAGQGGDYGNKYHPAGQVATDYSDIIRNNAKHRTCRAATMS